MCLQVEVGGLIQEGVVCSYDALTTAHSVQFNSEGPGTKTSATTVSVDFSRDTVVSCDPQLPRASCACAKRL